MRCACCCRAAQVVPCLAIHDTMRHVKSDVGTVGFGGAMGMSGFLLAVGKKVRGAGPCGARYMRGTGWVGGWVRGRGGGLSSFPLSIAVQSAGCQAQAGTVEMRPAQDGLLELLREAAWPTCRLPGLPDGVAFPPHYECRMWNQRGPSMQPHCPAPSLTGTLPGIHARAPAPLTWSPLHPPGAQGKRYALANTRIMIHHPSGAARGQASDINREARELLRIRDYMDAILAEATGQPFDKVRNTMWKKRRNLKGPGEVIEPVRPTLHGRHPGRSHQAALDSGVQWEESSERGGGLTSACALGHRYSVLAPGLAPLRQPAPPPSTRFAPPPTLLQVAYDFSRNKYFSTEEALEYGVIDNIVKPKRSALAGV